MLVFISHSSEDKASFIEPIVADLESCYINIWFDKRKIIPGDNLRKSIFKDGLDKADIVLIFFTQQSLSSAWVDREIKHVLREETNKGNNFDLRKIISIFDTEETYKQISDRYPELTDDLLHLIPPDYNKIHIGQLISAIWSKYMTLQGGDIESQKLLLAKEKELFQKDKEIDTLRKQIIDLKNKETGSTEFESFIKSGKLSEFMNDSEVLITRGLVKTQSLNNIKEAIAFGLVEHAPGNIDYARLTKKGKDFFKWIILNN